MANEHFIDGVLREAAEELAAEGGLANDMAKGVNARIAEVKDVEREDLGIDWGAVDRDELIASMLRYEELTEAREGAHFDEVQIFQCMLPTSSGEELIFEALKVPKATNGAVDELQINVLRPKEDFMSRKYVADFDFARYPGERSERWNMKHRRTGAIYQGQGIGSEVLSLVEEFLKRRAEITGDTEFIESRSGQITLMRWLEKMGFEPKTKEHKARLELAKNPTENIKKFSAPERSFDMADRPQHYLFDVEDFARRFPDIEGGPANPMVWNERNYYEPFYYMKSSFGVLFEKRIG